MHLERPELNYLVLTGTVRNKEEMKASSYGTFVIRFQLENLISSEFESEARTYVLAVEAWGRLAERIDRSIDNGSFVLLEGNLVSRKYEDRLKRTRYRMTVKASSITSLGRETKDNRKDQ